MKKNVLIGAIMLLTLVACGKGDAQPTITSTIPQVPNTQTPSPIPPTETVTATLEPTTTGTPEPTSTAQPVIYGPTNFPDGINPLTGLQVADPDLLERRPIAVKINIVPRLSVSPALWPVPG